MHLWRCFSGEAGDCEIVDAISMDWCQALLDLDLDLLGSLGP